MYQTLGQRRNNWRRAVCDHGPDGKHVQDWTSTISPTLSACLYCRKPIRYEHVGGWRWMAPTQITLVEWP